MQYFRRTVFLKKIQENIRQIRKSDNSEKSIYRCKKLFSTKHRLARKGKNFSMINMQNNNTKSNAQTCGGQSGIQAPTYKYMNKYIHILLTE